MKGGSPKKRKVQVDKSMSTRMKSAPVVKRSKSADVGKSFADEVRKLQSPVSPKMGAKGPAL